MVTHTHTQTPNRWNSNPPFAAPRRPAVTSSSVPSSVSRLSHVTCFPRWRSQGVSLLCLPLCHCWEDLPRVPRRSPERRQGAEPITHTHDQASQTTAANPAGIRLDQPSPTDTWGKKRLVLFSKFTFYWSTVHLQCVHFCCAAKWIRYT